MLGALRSLIGDDIDLPLGQASLKRIVKYGASESLFTKRGQK